MSEHERDLVRTLGLPSPEVLGKLEEVSPGIVKFLQEELVAHRQAQQAAEAREFELAKSKLAIEEGIARRGQQYGLTIGIVAILCGTAAAILHAEIAGSFIGAGGVIGLVSVFVFQGRRK